MSGPGGGAAAGGGRPRPFLRPDTARGGLLGGGLGVLVGVVGAAGARGVRGDVLVGAVLGGVMAVATMSSGPLLLPRVLRRSAGAAFAAAVGGYTATVLVLGVVYVALRNAGWVDGPAVGVGLVAATLGAGAGQIVGAARERRPVFDGRDEG